jgi:hypothetical protein
MKGLMEYIHAIDLDDCCVDCVERDTVSVDGMLINEMRGLTDDCCVDCVYSVAEQTVSKIVLKALTDNLLTISTLQKEH